MTKTQVISNLWNEMREFINRAYEMRPEVETGEEDEMGCLRDYTENQSWSDRLARLLEREIVNEKQHRSNRPSIPGFSASTAAKLILMGNVITGSEMVQMPKATAFLVLRQTAVEAEVVGWLVRESLHKDWIRAVQTYAKLMASADSPVLAE